MVEIFPAGRDFSTNDHSTRASLTPPVWNPVLHSLADFTEKAPPEMPDRLSFAEF
jgi:hypothetical protein